MRIFTRYILREVVAYALLGGLLFTFVLFMRDLPKILDLVVRDSASLTDVLRIFADLLPNTLTVTLPTAVLAGILLGLSRLAADSEITAMRACGIGAFTFVRIVSILSFTALGLGLLNALYFAPRGAADLLRLEDQLKSSQASFEVQPRVFYEDFRNYVLYVQDVRPAAGAALWRHVFLADLTQPANPNVTTADRAIISSPSPADPQTLRLHLFDGGQHQISPTDPNQYDISTFTSSDVPLQLESSDDTHISRMDTPLHALPFSELWRRARNSANPLDARAASIEGNTRFSYPFACLVLTLIGVPLGLSSKRGGKSTGFVLTLLLVFAYYMLSEFGVGFARSGKLSPLLGVWGANLIFAAFGCILLQQLTGVGPLLNRFTSLAAALGNAFSAIVPQPIRTALSTFMNEEASEPHAHGEYPAESLAATHHPQLDGPGPAPHRSLREPRPTLFPRLRGLFRTSFPLLLDEYVLRAYATAFLLALAAFTSLYVVFTFFELIGDIVRNQTPFIIVGEYLFNLVPYILYAVTPLCSLLAVLITFGSLSRSSELTAMKATGISIYRVVAPIFVLAAILGVALFAFGESYLPQANRRQEQLRDVIKRKPAQTFLNPERKWISGQSGQSGQPGAPARIFTYEAFDPVRPAFAKLTVFEFDPQTFTLIRRIFATSVTWDPTVGRWVFDNGWQRTFTGETIANYQTFAVATFPEIREQPTYFNKEDKPSDEMSYAELSHYIADLSQSGFDTVLLRVQLDRKLADPAITLVMAILAVPFAVTMGKRRGLAGIATAIGVAISYWVVAGLFSSMGNIATLPPLLAAWSPDLLFGITGAYLLLRTPT
jgi:LPS export ABC transporter permease LptG/LPS export ABC transporter permease LptF